MNTNDEWEPPVTMSQLGLSNPSDDSELRATACSTRFSIAYLSGGKWWESDEQAFTEEDAREQIVPIIEKTRSPEEMRLVVRKTTEITIPL